MQPFFEDQKAWNILEQHLVQWVGTPRRHMQGTKGRGTDCAAYIAHSLYEAGILTGLRMPKYYPKDWATLPGHDSLILDHIRANFTLYLAEGVDYIEYTKRDLPVPYRGDIVLFTLRQGSQAVNHTGVVFGPRCMVHLSNTVCFTYYGETWQGMQASTFRLYRRP